MQTPLTIGQFIDSYLPVTDGVVSVVRNYAYWLNEKYGKCVVYAPNTKSFVNPDPFDVQSYLSIPIPGRKPYRFGFPALDVRYRKQLNQMQFDLVHSHSPFSSGSEALRVAKKQNIPLVGTFHSKFYDDFLQYFHTNYLSLFLLVYIVLLTLKILLKLYTRKIPAIHSHLFLLFLYY